MIRPSAGDQFPNNRCPAAAEELFTGAVLGVDSSHITGPIAFILAHSPGNGTVLAKRCRCRMTRCDFRESTHANPFKDITLCRA